MTGAIVLDKPEGITAHSAVARARKILRERRIGHTGTLDPFATGVLVLLAGQATRLARFYKDRDKTYQGAIRFGYATDTYDRTGKPASPRQRPSLDFVELQKLFREFSGAQVQQPPPISAKKIGGVPAYRLARTGRAPALAPISVMIHELELLSLEGEVAAFRARVSSGTYIRSLAHDLGQRLGCGAHLESLRRTAAGEFTESQAITLEQLEDAARAGAVPLIPMESLLPEIPSVALSGAAVRSALHGQSIELSCHGSWVKLLSESGELIAMAECKSPNTCHPAVVFSPPAGERESGSPADTSLR